jgi:signal transduction histidine kinase
LACEPALIGKSLAPLELWQGGCVSNPSLGNVLQELRAQQSLLAAAERAARIGTYVHDPKTDLAIWSRQLKRIFEFPDDDSPVELETFLARVHPEDLPGLQATLSMLRRVGDRQEHAYRIVLPGGEIRYLEAWGEMMRIAAYDHPVLVGTTQDATERWCAKKVIEEQAVALAGMQAELLYRSGQDAMGTMAATLAHELNQPLTSITFFAAAATRLIAAGRTDDLVPLLSSLQENAVRAGDIIRRLRDSVASGRPKSDRFTCREVVEEAVRFSSIGCEGIRIVIDIADCPIEGADRVQIQQVLVNLIRNACQATNGRTDPLVTITSSLVSGPEPRLRLTIDDNGPGIDETILPHVFDGRMTTKRDGMGLGLSISRTIIEAHGGRLWAENTGTGARFAFEIPLQANVR